MCGQWDGDGQGVFMGGWRGRCILILTSHKLLSQRCHNNRLILNGLESCSSCKCTRSWYQAKFYISAGVDLG